MPDRRLQGRGDHDRQADVLGDAQAGAHAAQRLHLEHGDVGGLQVAHPVGVGGAADRLVGGDRHVDPAPYDREVLDARRPAARRTRGRRRRASSSGDRGDRVVDRPERRWRRCGSAPSGPSASRTASSRASSSARRLAGLGDLHLGGAAATREHDRVRLLGSDGRHGDVDRHRGAQRAPASRRPRPRAAQRSQGAATAASYSRNGLHSPHPAPPHEHDLAHGDAAEAGAHRDRQHSQRLTPAPHELLAGASAVGLAVGQQRDRVDRDDLARRPRPRVRGGDPVAQPSCRRGRRARPRRRRAGCPTPRRARRSPPPSSTSGWARSRAATAGPGTLTPPLTTTSSTRPSTCSRPSSSIAPASEVRNHPSTSTCAVSSGSPS